jgi:hypothetical protein
VARTEEARSPLTVLSRGLLFLLAAVLLATWIAPTDADVAHAAPSSHAAEATHASDDVEIVAAGSGGGGGGGGYSDTDAGVCSSSGDRGASSLLLPLTRWGDATTQFTSNIGGSHWIQNAQKMGRELQFMTLMSVGNTLWDASSSLTLQAAAFCPLRSIGAEMDNAAATVGEMIADSGILAGIIVITLVVLIFQASRTGASAFRQIVSKILVAGLFAVLVIGAGNSSKPGDGEFEPGFLSPGWFVTTTTDAVTALAAAPASQIVGQMEEQSRDRNAGISEIHSDNYLAALHSGYRTEFNITVGGGDSGGTAGVGSVVPLTLSQMWESTGLEAWKIAQFGADNTIGDKTYSFLLDWQAGIPGQVKSASESPGSNEGNDEGSDRDSAEIYGFPMSASQRAVWNQAVKDDSIDTSQEAIDLIGASNFRSVMFNPPDNEQETRALTALGFCNVQDGDWYADDRDKGENGRWAGWNQSESWAELKDEFFKLQGNAWPDGNDDDDNYNELDGEGEECNRLVAGLESGGIKSAPYFSQWGSDPTKIRNIITDPQFAETRDYMLHVHGAGTAGVIPMFVHAVSSLAVFLVFGVISLGVMLSKIMVVAMMVAVFALLALVLLPNVETQRLGKFVKTLMGAIVFSAMLSLIISVVAMMSRLLVTLGEEFAGKGSALLILWTGFAPLLAVIAIQWIFKSVLGLPSPFKLTSAMAYGSAANAMGGAAASGMGQMGSGAGRMARTGARVVGGAVRNRGLKKAVGGSGSTGEPTGTGSERRGAMAPVGSNTGEKPLDQKLGAVEQAASKRKAASKGSLFGKAAAAGGAAAGAVGSAVGRDIDAIDAKAGKLYMDNEGFRKFADGAHDLGENVGRFGRAAGGAISSGAGWLNSAGGALLDRKAHKDAATSGKSVNPRSMTQLSRDGIGKAKKFAVGAGQGISSHASVLGNAVRGSAVGRAAGTVTSAVGRRASAVGGWSAKVGRGVAQSNTGRLVGSGVTQAGSAVKTAGSNALGAARTNIANRAKLAGANVRAHPIKTAGAAAGTMAAGVVAGPAGLAAGAGIMAMRSQRDPAGRSRKQVRADAAAADQRNKDDAASAQRLGFQNAEELRGHRQQVAQEQADEQSLRKDLSGVGFTSAEANEYVAEARKGEEDLQNPMDWLNERRGNG